MDDLVKVQDDSDCCWTSLVNLPTELLVIILSYLPIRDIILMQFVSQRFKEISEIPLLWKKFIWPDYEPCHVCSVSKVLRAHGEHVRQIFFPSHLTPGNILEMVHCCPKVTHLSLPRNTQLSLDHLEEIVHIMTHLEQLDASSIMKYNTPYCIIKKILEVTTASVRKLILKLDWPHELDWPHDRFSVVRKYLCILEELLKNGHPLPSIINLLIDEHDVVRSSRILESWPSSIYTIASLEIGLYDIARVPMDLYPPIPLRKFRFGPAATPPLIKLSDHGILGLDKDTFYLSVYDHYGKVRLSVSPRHIYLYSDLYGVKDEYLHCISNFDSVSNVDFSDVNIYPGHLEQLAIACPNLERLNLGKAQNCLQSLQGLHATVDTCQNLQGLNLVGIPVSSVESYLLLWESLSSIKKLTHLAIDLCMLIQSSNCDSADKEKFISMLRNCVSLKALEIIDHKCKGCQNVHSVNDLFFSHFPSLVYVRLLFQARCITAFKYIITNCHQLKYLYYERDSEAHVTLPSSSSCHLQQLFISSFNINLSTPSVHVLSAHGELEQVALYVNSITTSAITTLISSSPNLMLLYIVTIEPLCDENGVREDCNKYKDTVSKTFSYHKLLTTGDFILEDEDDRSYHYYKRFQTLAPNSLWKLDYC